MKSARHPKESSSLRFKFSILFIIFAVIAIVTSGIETYTSQAEEYEEQCLQNIRNIGDYLESIIQEAGEEFVWYQNYYMNHYKELNIPYGFSEYLNAQRRYENMLVKYGISIQSDTRKINPSELPAEVQEAYCIYLHEYYLLTFENARKAFGLPYTYYLVPREEIFHMVYMIDGERTEKNDAGEKVKTGEGNGFLYLGGVNEIPPVANLPRVYFGDRLSLTDTVEFADSLAGEGFVKNVGNCRVRKLRGNGEVYGHNLSVRKCLLIYTVGKAFFYSTIVNIVQVLTGFAE